MSVCAACGAENRAGRKFCARCGAPLAIGCPACGAANQPDELFCGECGAALASPVPFSPLLKTVSVAGERKHITVLFADVAGSMDLQERLDAEVWAQTMSRFVGILAEGVRKYGGTVDKFTGDGIMALFGAPVAQEDHARRACHAAWHLTKAIGQYSEKLRRDQGIELHVRLGLNSGEVVVGRVGDDMTLDPTALGHTVGLAQRMEAMAEPGKAYLTEHTARLVKGWFGIEELGPRLVKGATEPLDVYALGIPVSPAVRRTVGASPLVGRERELSMLEDALDMAVEGQFQVVGVVGEAGVGKSRLCEEFVRSVSDRGITVRRAAGVSHGRDLPLLPILAFQREYFGITDTDDPEMARRKVTERLLELDPDLDDVLPLLFDFLEVPDPDRPLPPMSPEVRMRRIFDAVRRITARRSERETLVLLFEDLHWFDPQSEAFLERLIESYPGSRTLVVTNFRPELSAGWMRHSYYRQLPLGPLREQAVGELLSGLLGVDLSLAPLISFVLERTGGNPFFVEEVIRALIEDGTLAGRPGKSRLTRPLHEIRVPPSVQTVLAARIDRLPADQKAILQTASVIGRTFDPAVLRTVSGSTTGFLEDALSSLCAAEMLQHSGHDPVSEYRFWHPRTQEVAYESLLRDHRRTLHATVADALAQLDPARNDERAALIASHFARADALLDYARWEDKAAAWSQRVDFSEAVERWRNALAALDKLPRNDETTELGVTVRAQLLRTASRIGFPAEETDRYFAEGQAMAQQLGDPSALCLLFLGRGAEQFIRGEIHNARGAYREMRRLAAESGDRELIVTCSVGSVYLPYVSAAAPDLSYLENIEAMCGGDCDLGSRHPGYSPLIGVMRYRGELLALAGHLAESRRQSERALTLARQRAEAEMIPWVLADLARLAELVGEYDRDPARDAGEAVAISQESANLFVLVLAQHALGVAEILAGNHRRAEGLLTEALTRARTHRAGLFQEGYLLAHLAAARLAQEDVDTALQYADQAVNVARRQGAPIVECFTLLTRGRMSRLNGNSAGAKRDLDAALALLEDTGAHTYEPFIREELGRLHNDQRELGEAVALYQQIAATGHARRLEAELSAKAVR